MSILSPFSRRAAIAALAAVFALGSQAAFEVTITAPGGVGNVAALTNALTYVNTVLTHQDRDRARIRILLEQGLYDLRGIYMKSDSHLYIAASQDGMIAGLGEKPGDTILLGGGAAEGHRVLGLDGGGNYGWMNVSNLTVTGGYWAGYGGGISANGSTKYSNLIVTNNYAGNGGAGCYKGRAVNCYFANNTTAGSGGGLYADGGGGQMESLVQGAWNCVFATNSANSVGGGLYLSGKCIDCTFLGNTAGYGGGIGVAAKNYSWSGFSDTTEISGGTFVGNASSQWGHGAVLYYPTAGALIAVSNCTFAGNIHDHGGCGIVYGMDLSDCTLTNNFAKEYVVHTCNLTGCLIASNSTSSAANNAYGLIRNSHFSDCTISNNVSAEYLAGASTFERCMLSHNLSASDRQFYGCEITNSILRCIKTSSAVTYDCNMYGCLLLDNTNTNGAASMDYSSVVGAHTNVNCLFKGNVMTSYGRLARGKAFVNCTIVSNDCRNGGNYGYICTPDCSLVNCILSGNKIGWQYFDIRPIYGSGALGDAHTNALDMVNCIFVNSQNGVGADWEGLVNCLKVSDVRFADAASGDYTPTTRSAAYNAGCQEPWILALLGEKDLAGNPRVYGGALDIGAYECQKDRPGLWLMVK